MPDSISNRSRVALWALLSMACAAPTVPPDASAPDASAPDATTVLDAGASPEPTAAQLEAFWSAHGGRGAFPETYVSAVETMLFAEDEVVAGDYAAARSRLDALFARVPLSDPAWWSGVGLDGTNVGTPVAYYGLRMLDEVANVGLAPREPALEPIAMTVVLVECAEGQRPLDVELSTGEPVSLRLDPAVSSDDHRIIHQSLRLFRRYIWAITGGRRDVEVTVQSVAACQALSFGGGGTGAPYSGLTDASSAIREVATELADRTDFWWVLYPSNVPSDPIFDDTAFVTGGMGAWGASPVFIIDDLWLVRKPPHLGRGPYSEVERRVYLPQWLQHELFHHLFRTWPEHGLEASDHQWFDRATWPADFVGEWEPDYYAEALHRRLLGSTPPPWLALRTAPVASAFDFTAEDLVGSYVRLPVENGYHEVEVTLEAGTLWWSNEAGARWSLTLSGRTLRTGADCPYGVSDVTVVGSEGATTGLRFNGELYRRR